MIGDVAFGDLIGVGEVKLAAVREARRAQREFPARIKAYDQVMGKKRLDSPMLLWSSQFVGVGFEVIGVEDPAVKRNGDAELPFLSRSPCSGAKPKFWLLAKFDAADRMAVTSGGA